MGVFCDRLNLCSSAALDCLTGQNKGRYRKKRPLIPTRFIDQEQGIMGKSKAKQFEACLHPYSCSKAIELRKAKEKSRHHDDEQCHSTLPAAKLFSPYNSKLNQCTITKRKFPPMDDDEMPSSFELWRTQCTMGTNTF